MRGQHEGLPGVAVGDDRRGPLSGGDLEPALAAIPDHDDRHGLAVLIAAGRLRAVGGARQVRKEPSAGIGALLLAALSTSSQRARCNHA